MEIATSASEEESSSSDSHADCCSESDVSSNLAEAEPLLCVEPSVDSWSTDELTSLLRKSMRNNKLREGAKYLLQKALQADTWVQRKRVIASKLKIAMREFDGLDDYIDELS